MQKCLLDFYIKLQQHFNTMVFTAVYTYITHVKIYCGFSKVEDAYGPRVISF